MGQPLISLEKQKLLFMHIGVLGGGAMGRISVRELAEHPSVTRVTVAGFNPRPLAA